MKPIRGILLNKSHPLARNLIVDWPFNEGTGKIVSDLSGNRHTGIITGAVWTAGKFGFGSALRFTEDSLSASAITGLASFSYEIYVKSHVSGPGTGCFVYNNDGTYRREFSNSATYDKLLLYLTNDIYYFFDGVNWDDGNCHHLVATYNGVTPYVYMDGKQYSNTGSGNPSDAFAQGLTIGNKADLTRGLDDSNIGYTRIYNSALSPPEIALLLRKPFCMYEPPVLPTRLLIPTVLTDYNKNKILEHIVGKTSLTLADVSVALGTAGDGYGSFTEVMNVNNYSRFATSTLDWNVASNGEITNCSDIIFPEASGAWGEISHYALFDSSVYGEGNLLLIDTLDTPKNILTKDIMVLNANDLKITLD